MKARSPMVVTESGMVTVFTAFLSTPHSSHESSPSSSQGGLDTIVMVPSGMSKCPSALADGAAPMLSTTVVVSSDERALVPSNAANSILYTLFLFFALRLYHVKNIF